LKEEMRGGDDVIWND